MAALAPKAGPSLTKDPLGLLWSATAAGFGVLYLALAVCGAPRRLRLGVTAVAAALAIGVPALVLAGIGSRTGVVRAQDPAVVQAEADGGRLLALRSPYTLPPETSPRGRQAFSESFRLDPPAEILPSRPLLPPGPSVLAGLARAIGVRDLRLVAVLALGVLAAVAAVGFEGRRRRAALALALLVAPLALGTVLGSPVALSLAALVGAWAAGRRGVGLGAGLLAGAAVGLDHRAALVVPFLVLAPESRGAVRRGLAGAVVAYLLVVAPVALLDPGAFVSRLGERDAPGPGLGLFNLLAYRGAEASAGALALAALAPLLSLGIVLWLLRRPWPPLALARDREPRRDRARAGHLGGGRRRAPRAAGPRRDGAGGRALRLRAGGQAGVRPLVLQERTPQGWCRRRDSNPHGFLHTPLKRACLPIPPLRHGGANV